MKVCVDKKSDNYNQLFSLYNAYKERPSNLLLERNGEIKELDAITEGYLNRSVRERDLTLLHILSQERRDLLLELAIWRDKKWAIGRTIKVKFLEGTQFLKDKVRENALIWTRFANLDFDFDYHDDAEIRISFQPGNGSWSYIGTDCLNITDQAKPTMNYGWFDDHTHDLEFSRTVLHEFGHALGCIHEHQSPAANIPWDRPAVYAYYAASQGWSREEVDNNIFAVYDNSIITNSTYDDHSIMLYPIDGALTAHRYSVRMNTILSMTDIDYVRQWYPGR
jgi:serralysin